MEVQEQILLIFKHTHTCSLSFCLTHSHTLPLPSFSFMLFLIRSLIFFFSLPHFGITGGRVGRFFPALCSILSAQSACVNPWANLSLNAKCDFKKWNKAGKYHCHNTLFWDLASTVIFFWKHLKKIFLEQLQTLIGSRWFDAEISFQVVKCKFFPPR